MKRPAYFNVGWSFFCERSNGVKFYYVRILYSINLFTFRYRNESNATRF